MLITNPRQFILCICLFTLLGWFVVADYYRLDGHCQSVITFLTRVRYESARWDVKIVVKKEGEQLVARMSDGEVFAKVRIPTVTQIARPSDPGTGEIVFSGLGLLSQHKKQQGNEIMLTSILGFRKYVYVYSTGYAIETPHGSMISGNG